MNHSPTSSSKPKVSSSSGGSLLKLKNRSLSPFRRRDKSPAPQGQRDKSPNPFRSRGTSPFRKPRGLSPFGRRARSLSWGSDDNSDEGGGVTAVSTSTTDNKRRSNHHNIVVCHESARSIVFRDHLRLAAKIIQEEEEEEEDEDDDDKVSVASGGSAVDALLPHSLRQGLRQSIRESIQQQKAPAIQTEINELAHTMVPELANVTLQVPYVSEQNVEIEGLNAHLAPFEELELDSKYEFSPLLESEPSTEISESWTFAEQQVFTMLKDQMACVKTIKNSEWPSFLNRFQTPKKQTGFHFPSEHDDIGPHDGFPFNSFVTSTSLLPSLGQKMRCFGSLQSYPIGAVFGLPEKNNVEDQIAEETLTWAWPAGYAAKTEFNIDNKGRLINGRQEALVPLSTMRQYNDDYLHKDDHMIAGKLRKGGFNVIPYNEVFLRVGGKSREVDQGDSIERSFDKGCGLFVALFVRSITVGDIMSLFRTRARVASILGEECVRDIPLLYISNEHGVRVFTKELQREFLRLIASKVQPFQNPIIAPQVRFDDTNESCLQQKIEELIDINDGMRGSLSSTECARIAGGFGLSDESLLRTFCQSNDILLDTKEGLASSIRAGDFYSARQILIAYVAADLVRQRIFAGPTSIDFDGPACMFSDMGLLQSDDPTVHSGIILPQPLGTSRLRRAVSQILLRSFVR
jgi:hypothetical protein